MSYLGSPRIHFAGRFQADVSTVNNDVRHYDIERFRPEFQEPMQVKDLSIVKFNGYWNPQGTAAWRMLGCKVTSAVVDGQIYDSPDQDPVIGFNVGGSNDRVAGKLVDLDPQQQMVSEIWGLAIRLEDAKGTPAFSSEFEVAPFTDLWWRQQKKDPTDFFDQQLAAAFQSVLTRVNWSSVADSPTLSALKARSDEGLLSIRLNVFGYDRTPGADDYSTGVVVGTIGPAFANESKRFVKGRHLTTAYRPFGSGPPFVPVNEIGNIQAVVDSTRNVVSADFGNAFPITNSSGTLQDLGSIDFGILKDPNSKQGDSIGSDQFALLGNIPYQQDDWLFKTAGIQEFSLEQNSDASPLIGNHPLAVVSSEQNSQVTILNRESGDGLYVRADMYVFRLNPGDSVNVDFHATKYGKPLSATIATSSTAGLMGGEGTGAKLPSIEVPDVNTPAEILSYDSEFTTDPDGYRSVKVSVSADGPQNPRKYIDGQLYGINYQLKDLPDGYITNPLNYLSLLAWDKFDVPENPTWYQHIQPILTQYGNLYPIMSVRLVDLSDYDSVVANIDILKLSFELPVHNPNSMPVTRDLSANKRRTILKWLNSKDPKTGLPPLGAAPPRSQHDNLADSGIREVDGDELDWGSKVDFIRQVAKRREG